MEDSEYKVKAISGKLIEDSAILDHQPYGRPIKDFAETEQSTLTSDLDKMSSRIINDVLVFNFFHERRAHPPLGTGVEVSHGVKVVITERHVNR